MALPSTRWAWGFILGEKQASFQGWAAWSQTQLSQVLSRWVWPGVGATAPGLPLTPGLLGTGSGMCALGPAHQGDNPVWPCSPKVSKE